MTVKKQSDGGRTQRVRVCLRRWQQCQIDDRSQQYAAALTETSQSEQPPAMSFTIITTLHRTSHQNNHLQCHSQSLLHFTKPHTSHQNNNHLQCITLHTPVICQLCTDREFNMCIQEISIQQQCQSQYLKQCQSQYLKCGNEVIGEWTSVGRHWHVTVQLRQPSTCCLRTVPTDVVFSQKELQPTHTTTTHAVWQGQHEPTSLTAANTHHNYSCCLTRATWTHI